MDTKPMGGPPADLMNVAAQADATEDALWSEAAPQGEFTAKGLNALVKALNQALPLFQVEPYPEFTEDTDILPSDFVKQLQMVLDAGAEAGVLGDPVDLSSLENDRDLVMVAGKVAALAKNPELKSFLAAPAKPKPDAGKPKASAKPEPPAEDIDALFAQRA